MFTKDTRTGGKMRNWPCPCNANPFSSAEPKKFKNCCWAKWNTIPEDEPSEHTLRYQKQVEKEYRRAKNGQSI